MSKIRLKMSIGLNIQKLLVWVLVVGIFSGELWGLDPERAYSLRPERFGIAYEEIQIETPDGYGLNAWMMSPADSVARGSTVVIAYGDAGNMGYCLAYAFNLLRRGHHVLTFDYRGFAQSEDFAMDTSQYYYNEFAVDLAAAVQRAREWQPENRVGVWAFSMGSLMAVLAWEQSPFDWLAAEGVIHSPKRTMERIIQEKGIRQPLPAGAEDAPNKAGMMDIPMLLFCGEEDSITTCEEAREMTEGHPERRVVTFAGGHLQGVQRLGFGKYLDEMERIIP